MRTENIHSSVTPHAVQRRKRQFHRLMVEEVPVFKDDYQDMDDFEDPKETKERMKNHIKHGQHGIFKAWQINRINNTNRIKNELINQCKLSLLIHISLLYGP